MNPDQYSTGGYYDRQATASQQTTGQPHEHRASCHGAIGELQCGYETTKPPSDGEMWRRSMTLVTQIFVIITCIVVLVTAAEGWHIYFAVRDAMEELGNSFRNSGLGGN